MFVARLVNATTRTCAWPSLEERDHTLVRMREETADGVSWTAIWTKSGHQGNIWLGATVSIATVNVIRVRWLSLIHI